jgi:hypothetical protein
MLKDVQHLLSADPYYAGTAGCIGSSIEKLHQDMSKLELPSSVPEGIRRCHDAVRHTYIYSYFSYDLVTVAASQTLRCVEFALRERIGHQWKGKTNRKGKPLRPTLDPLLKAAESQGLISYIPELARLRNDFAHGSDAVWNPPMFLPVFEAVTALLISP